MYSLIFLGDARKKLTKLDKATVRRIKRKLDWMVDHIEEIEPDWLRHELTGFAKIREGDYRIVCEVRKESRLILVHSIGHRSEIYKDR